MDSDRARVARTLKTRVLERVRAHPSPTDRAAEARAGALLASCMGISFALFVLLGGIRCAPRPWQLVLTTCAGGALVSCLVFWLAFGRGRRMAGRPRWHLVVGGLGTPVVWFAWKLFWTSRYEGMLETGLARFSSFCFTFTLVVASIPLLGSVLVLRDTDPIHPRSLGAAVGAAVWTYAVLLVDLWCPAGSPAHVLASHVLPAFVLVPVGAMLGCIWLKLSFE